MVRFVLSASAIAAFVLAGGASAHPHHNHHDGHAPHRDGHMMMMRHHEHDMHHHGSHDEGHSHDEDRGSHHFEHGSDSEDFHHGPPPPHGPHHGPRHGGKPCHRHHEKAVHMAKTHAHMLEDQYVADCVANPQPHGFYGAFLRPCTFTFIEEDASSDENSCVAGTVVGRPVPMHWLFNQTGIDSPEFWSKENWSDVYDFGSSSSSSSSSDSSDSFDIEKVDWEKLADRLMLWPDQCVGAGPRCYNLADGDDAVVEALHHLFPNEDAAPWDTTFTHVQVDCQADAMELSRVVYATAEVVDSAVPIVIAVSIAAVSLSLVLALWCCYASVRLYKAWGDHGMTNKVFNKVYNGVPVEEKNVMDADVIVVADDTEKTTKGDAEYKSLLA